MWTDNSDPDRYAMQPETDFERELLDVLCRALSQFPEVERRYWTFDVPEYPGLSRLAWQSADDSDPPSAALVIDLDPEAVA